MRRRSIFSFALALVMLLSMVFCPLSASAAQVDLTTEQRNAISMLNYLTVLTQDINASKNSRLYVEEAYSSLVNNTNPNAVVDNLTLTQLTGLLDILENYRMISVKRERLQFIYEQNMAQAMREAVPNPLGLLSAVHSGNFIDLAASIAYMAVDAVTSYNKYTSETELQYIQDGWALDDEEANTLHDSRKSTFSYMVKMVQDYGLPEGITLTERTVEDFVKWKNNENITGRIQFLESNRQTYQNYSGYWLLLAESYYKNKDYEKCISAIESCEAIRTRIFRKDYDFANTLPLAIAAAGEVYDGEEFVEYTSEKVEAILSNIENDNWALRYFVAQTYVDLYGKTEDTKYLDKAYSTTLDNVNYLVEKQKSLNATYLASVQKVTVPKDASKEEKTQLNNYNKMLEENRKKELPPVYEPLLLNVELLFGLATEKNIGAAEQAKITNILHPQNEPLFLSSTLDELYWFDKVATEADTSAIEYAGTAIKLPVVDVTDGTNIKVAVTTAEGDTSVYEDWTIKSVTRPKNSGIEEWEAIYESESIRKHEWKPDETVMITVSPKANSSAKDIKLELRTVGTKTEWYDYLKVWEGHNNEWYDYLKVWENKVKFER